MAKSSNAYVKIIVTSNIKHAMSEFAKAHPRLAAFGSAVKKAGLIGAAGVAALVAGLYILKRAITSALREYEDYMMGLVKIQRVTGLAARGTSILAGQMRLSGVDSTKGAKGLQFFARNLDTAREAILKARRGLADLDKTSEDYADKLADVELRIKDAGGAFTRLGIDLTDAGGEYRDTADILADVRDKISEIEDPAKRTAIAMKLFGKGGADLLPWLTKSSKKMEEFAKFLKDTGLIMSEQTMKSFADYRENQRKMGLAWEAIKVSAASALVPLLNEWLPDIIKVIQRAAGWMGRFRRLVERKGWRKAWDEMLPGGKSLRDVIEKMWTYAKKFGAYIIEHEDDIKRAFKAIATIVEAIADTLAAAYRFAVYLANLDVAAGQGKGKGGTGKGTGSNRGSGISNANAVSSHEDAEPVASHGKDAWGGIYTRPRRTLVGEAGPEVIIPLTKPLRAAQLMAAAGLGGPTVVNVYLDSEPIAARVEVRQQKKARRLARTAGAFA